MYLSSLLVAVLETLCNFCEKLRLFSSFIYVAFASMLSGVCHNSTTVKSSTLYSVVFAVTILIGQQLCHCLCDFPAQCDYLVEMCIINLEVVLFDECFNGNWVQHEC